MRRIVLAFAVLFFARPAWAVVYITATHLGGGVVAIDYNSVGEPNLPRAFALDITVTEGNITDCCDYAVGDDNGGFGIFPGNFTYITVLEDGTVQTWEVGEYTPLAGPGHPTALGGLGTNGITIEMGSLYDANAPGKTGRLCTITVDSNPALLSVTLNALSGGVVLEDPNAPVDVNVAGATDVPIGAPDCFPSDYTTYDDWVEYGKPDCWCGKGSGAQTIPDADLGYQCDGDADSGTSGFQKYRIFSPDFTILAANWKKKIDDPTIDPCADFDHKSSGFQKYRVFSPDFTILVTNWKKKDVDLPGDCPRPE